MDEMKTAPQDRGAVNEIGKSRSVKLIEVIEVQNLYGAGTEGSPYRIATEYWSKEGELLAVNDPDSGC